MAESGGGGEASIKQPFGLGRWSAVVSLGLRSIKPLIHTHTRARSVTLGASLSNMLTSKRMCF